jgi:hypothetical protein
MNKNSLNKNIDNMIIKENYYIKNKHFNRLSFYFIFHSLLISQ